MIIAPVASAAGADAIQRIVETARAVADQPLPSASSLRARCAGDALCVAHRLVETLGPAARLERVRHPDTDSIRLVTSRPSVTAAKRDSEGRLVLALERFGRTAVDEIREAAASAPRGLVLDLRRNQGGEIDRMLRVAALFTGAVADAVTLSGGGGVRQLSIPPAAGLALSRPVELIVGPETASSAEIFAALLRAHAHARITGRRTYGKLYLHRVVPVTHDWQLLVPGDRIAVPGARTAGGVVPDGPTPQKD